MSELRRTLSVWRGTAMMLNIVLGAGLLTLPGLAVQAAGTAALAVWLTCAVAAVPLLAVFAILGRRFPDAGGLAAYMKRAFGEPGYVCASFLFLGAVAVGLPAIALTGGYYAAAVLGGPPALYAALLIAGAAIANLASAEIAGRVNAVLASLIVVVLAGIAVAGWFAVSPNLRHVALVPETLPGASTLGAAVVMVFFAFTGWEVGANLGGEFKSPERDFPIAIAASFLIAVVLYLALALVVAAAGPVGANEAPFAAIFARHFGAAGGQAVALVSVVMIFANLSAAIWAVSRMVYSAGERRLLPSGLTRLRAGVPLRSVALTTGVLLVVVFLSTTQFLDLGLLLGAAGQNFLLLYAGAAAALIRLTRRPAHRGLATVSLVMVAGLILLRGISGMLYPATLVMLGLSVVLLRAQPASMLEGQIKSRESA